MLKHDLLWTHLQTQRREGVQEFAPSMQFTGDEDSETAQNRKAVNTGNFTVIEMEEWHGRSVLQGHRCRRAQVTCVLQPWHLSQAHESWVATQQQALEEETVRRGDSAKETR